MYVTWDGKRDVLGLLFLKDVGVVNLSGWMDGWIDKWVEQDLDRVVGDADWISVLEMGVGRPWVGCLGIGDDFLGRT